MNPLYLLFALTALTASATAADIPEPIARSLDKLLPAQAVERSQPSGVPGIAEVVVDGRVLYVSEDGRYVFDGTLIDAAQRSNLTERSRSRIRQETLQSLPEDVSITFAPADPRYSVTVFTAVDCGFCRRFHGNIEAYNAAGIAVNYILIPLAGPGSDAERSSTQVHCAADRKAAFTAATFGRPVDADADCKSNYASGVQAALRMGVNTTPQLISAKGELLGGYMEPAQLLARLQPAEAVSARP